MLMVSSTKILSTGDLVYWIREETDDQEVPILNLAAGYFMFHFQIYLLQKRRLN